MSASHSNTISSSTLTTTFLLAIIYAGAPAALASPFNVAPDGTAFMGIGPDTSGASDTIVVHFGPINEVNDQVYATGSVALAPSAYTIFPDPDGVTGAQSNGVDTCCDAAAGTFHFAGILFSSPVNDISSVQVQNFIANDGGWWGGATDVAGGTPIAAGDITSPQVQVTTNSGLSWTDVTTVTSDYVAKVTGVVRGAGFPLSTRTPFSTITFAPQSGINGIRLIGDGAGAAGGAGGGFVALTELQVNQDAGVVFPTLDINLATGAMTLKTTAGTARAIQGYSISSATTVGAIKSSSWLSVADNYDEGHVGPNVIDSNDPWTELSAASSRVLISEAELSGGNGGSLGASLNLPLGNVWIQNPFGDDVQAEVLLTDGRTRRINVTYNGQPSNPLTMGDLNFDGSINSADWPAVRNNFNLAFVGMSRAEAYVLGDITGDGFNNAADFAAFKALYDAANGAGAFAQMTSGVPEPGTAMSVAFAAAVLMGCIGRNGRKR